MKTKEIKCEKKVWNEKVMPTLDFTPRHSEELHLAERVLAK
jgi:hypothetical protein